jgi:hypothetical protein
MLCINNLWLHLLVCLINMCLLCLPGALDAQLAATNASNAQAAARLPGDTAGEEADAGELQSHYMLVRPVIDKGPIGLGQVPHQEACGRPAHACTALWTPQHVVPMRDMLMSTMCMCRMCCCTGPEGSSVENDADELGATREATGGAPAGGSGGAGGQQLPGTAADQAAPLGGPATDAGRRLRGAMAVA